MFGSRIVIEKKFSLFAVYVFLLGGLGSVAFDGRISFTYAFVFGLSYVLAVLLHELGHAMAAWLMAMDILRFRIGFGAGVTILGHSKFVAAMGPAMSLIVGIDFILIGGWTSAIGMAGWCALIDGAYNLLPISKADGSKIWLSHA